MKSQINLGQCRGDISGGLTLSSFRKAAINELVAVTILEHQTHALRCRISRINTEDFVQKRSRGSPVCFQCPTCGCKQLLEEIGPDQRTSIVKLMRASKRLQAFGSIAGSEQFPAPVILGPCAGASLDSLMRERFEHTQFGISGKIQRCLRKQL